MKNLLYSFSLLLLLNACGGKNEYDVNTGKNYENNKKNLEKTEQRSPAVFMSIKGIRKKNILGQSIIKGEIINMAKIVSYKDIDVKLFFYSKTGTLLEEDHEVLYENIPPGGNRGPWSRCDYRRVAACE